MSLFAYHSAPMERKNGKKKFSARFRLVTKSKQHLNVPSKRLPQHGAVCASNAPLCFFYVFFFFSVRIRVESGAAEVVGGFAVVVVGRRRKKGLFTHVGPA